MLSFCRLEIPLQTYVRPYKDTKFLNEIPFHNAIVYCAIYHVEFLQIRSHL